MKHVWLLFLLNSSSVNTVSPLNKHRAFTIRRFNINVPIRRRTDSPRYARREEAAARRTPRVMRRTPGILLTVLTNRISIARCQLSGRIIFDRAVRQMNRRGAAQRSRSPAPQSGIYSRRDCRAAHNYHETRNLGGRLPCERMDAA